MSDRIQKASDLLGLEGQDLKVQDLSGGWKRKSSIMCAIVHRPALLVLDEPTASLNTRSRHALWELVRMLYTKGTTIFFITHYIKKAEALCDHIGIIDNGRLAAIGTIDELRNAVGRGSGGRHQRLRQDHHDVSPVRDAVRAFVEGTDPGYVSIRRTTLEDLLGDDRRRKKVLTVNHLLESWTKVTKSSRATWCTLRKIS